MPQSWRDALPLLPLVLALAACGPGTPMQGPPLPAVAGGDAAEACRMRGAAAEDRYAGPIGDLSIDSALVRARVTEACLARRR